MTSSSSSSTWSPVRYTPEPSDDTFDYLAPVPDDGVCVDRAASETRALRYAARAHAIFRHEKRRALDNPNIPAASKKRLAAYDYALNKRAAAIGTCNHATRKIELSAYVVYNGASPEQLRTVLRHEIAHALSADREHHGPAWKSACLCIGGDGERVNYDFALAAMMPHKILIFCAKQGPDEKVPGHVHMRRQKRPPRNRTYRCKCGGELMVKLLPVRQKWGQ